VFSGVSATFGSTVGTAVTFGALTMFVFAVGATIPILVVTSISGSFSDKISTEKLIKDVGALLMIMVGILIMGITTYNLVR
jgi:cytochrome c biogenesis protein CcdA